MLVVCWGSRVCFPSPSTELQMRGMKVQTAAHCCANMTMELKKEEENNVFQTAKPFLAQKACSSQSCNQDILANVKKTHCYFPFQKDISGNGSFGIFLLQLQYVPLTSSQAPTWQFTEKRHAASDLSREQDPAQEKQ